MPGTDLNRLSLSDLFEHLAREADLDSFLRHVRREDLGPLGVDVTSETAFGDASTTRTVVRAREHGVLAGLAALPAIARAYGGASEVRSLVSDGDAIERGTAVATIAGPTRDILALERPVLNLIGRLSGVATRTAEFVRAMGDRWPARLYDTRKTTPGLRHIEKYAVRCGGGRSHRIGLHDAMMFKDNHIAALGGDWVGRIADAVRAARRRWPEEISFVEVEVDALEQFDALMRIEQDIVDLVLLDNMSVEDMRRAVDRKQADRPEWELEASGGVTLDTIADVASSGVDRISVGSLTHHAVSIDFGLDAD